MNKCHINTCQNPIYAGGAVPVCRTHFDFIKPIWLMPGGTPQICFTILTVLYYNILQQKTCR